MSSKTFTDSEAAQIAVEYARKRINDIAKSLRDMRERELKKAIIPPHKHTQGQVAGPSIEDVPPHHINPPGKNDAVKGEPMEDSPHGREETSGEKSPADVLDDAMKKEELCKKCGKSHDLAKGCTPEHLMDKSMLRDSKGKEKDNGIHPDSTLPEDKKSKELSADGSGGDIKKGKALNKAVQPPVAKPPSGKNMATHVPTSKPAVAKAGLSPDAKQHMLIDASRQAKPAAAAPTPKLPSPAEHAARAASFADFTPDAGVTGHSPKVGIFGRLANKKVQKSESLNKAKPDVPWKTSSLVAPPQLKPAGTGMTPAGAAPALTGTGTAASPKVGLRGAATSVLAEKLAAPYRSIPVKSGLAARPALKPAGAGLATAGASEDDTEGDKTLQSKTNPATPKALAADKTGAIAIKPKV